MNADGTNQIPLFSREALDNRSIRGHQNHKWSPDSSQIVFTAWDEEDEGSIYRVNSDGTSLKRIASGHFPRWSPDGKKIAFTNDDGLHIINADGTNNFKAVSLTSEEQMSMPAWSPDSTKVAFARGYFPYFEPHSRNLYIYSLRDRSVRQVTFFPDTSEKFVLISTIDWR